MELPIEIVEKIINYIDDINNYKCLTCKKNISCINKYIDVNQTKFCSSNCFYRIYLLEWIIFII